MNVIGLDIGGANLKAATPDGAARAREFALWREPQRLAEELRRLVEGWAAPDVWAVTMTGELADCFRTKAEGVGAILAAVEQVAEDARVVVWHTGGQFVTAEAARRHPLAVAADNWHVLATWAGRWLRGGRGLLIDIGSTTADFIPLADGRPVARGRTDVERLLAGELVYTGVRRTPVCAVAPTVPFRGGACPLAAELFATMQDVHLLLGYLAEDAGDVSTANGRPATRGEAHDRLARQICCDRSECALEEAVTIAAFLAGEQRRQMWEGMRRVLAAQGGPCDEVLISGAGAWLGRQIVAEEPALRGARVRSLEELVSPGVAESACAYAVAVLVGEMAVEQRCSEGELQIANCKLQNAK